MAINIALTFILFHFMYINQYQPIYAIAKIGINSEVEMAVRHRSHNSEYCLYKEVLSHE